MARKILSFITLIIFIFALSLPLCISNRAADGDIHVVYWSMNGKDSNKGTTENAPVKTLGCAFKLLAQYGSGGTVVLIDGVNTRANGKLTDLPDAGGTVTVTSVYGGKDYRKNATDPARLYLHYGYSFNNKVVFDGIDFVQASVSATDRAIYLKHNDLTVSSSCGFYSAVGSTSSDKCPSKGNSLTDSGTLILVTGYRSTELGSEAVRFEQYIDLQSGGYKRIYIGNKAYSAATDSAVSQARADSGTVFLTVGAKALISDLIDTTQDITPDIKAYVELTDTNTAVLVNDGGSLADTVTVRTRGMFELTGIMLKTHGGLPTIAVNAEVNAEWIDQIEATEFGFIFTLHNGSDSFFITKSSRIGRSYAYTEGENGYRNYRYRKDDINAAFSGVLVYDTDKPISYASMPIIAYPYAIDGRSGYTVTGAPCVFNLAEVCRLIIDNEERSRAERALASDISDLIAQAVEAEASLGSDAP